MERKLLVKVVLVSAASVVLTLLVIVGVAWAADIFTVDKDGTVRLKVDGVGALTITADNPGTSTLAVTGSGNPWQDVSIRIDNTTSGQNFSLINDGTAGSESFKIQRVGNSPALTILANGNPGSVGIGTSTPATSAKLEIAGTDGAILIPRLSTAQRDALTAANGMIVYNTSTNAFNFYENGAWVTRN